MSVSLSPQAAAELMAQGHKYLDVRSRAEFVLGHVPGSLHVPLLLPEHEGGGVDPSFVDAVLRLVEKDRAMIVGCESGQRSKVALALLVSAGFEKLHELGPGFGGTRDAFGRRIPGWAQCGLPVELGSADAAVD